MDKRKEQKFEPEKQIDFVKLIEALDWEQEISPVTLVKTVNKVAGLKGRWKYETNEVSYGSLIKSFEKRVSQFVDTRFHGKDRFYTIKDGIRKEQIVHFAKTGEFLELKKELEKKDSKFYIPEMTEPDKGKSKKISFPDNEALIKTIIAMGMMIKSKGNLKTAEYHKVRDEFGWKRQRSIEGKLYTNFQEVNKVTSWLDLGDLFEIRTRIVELRDPEKNLSILEGKISEVAALIDDEEMKEKALTLIKPEEKKIEEKVEEKVNEETITKPAPKSKPIERPRIIKASPEVGKSEFRETGTAPSIIYESSKVRWYKSLIAATFRGAERGVWYNFSDICNIIKKTRFTEIPIREVKDLCMEIGKQWKGIFREVDFSGVTVGSETLVKDFINAYPAEKITETIFLRLHMNIEELEKTYPELKFKIASEIGACDNVYEVEVNRAEKTEKAFAKLVFRMRHGEVILESPTNWTIKRTKILMDKLFGGI